MMTTATSQYHNARRPCRSSTDHSVRCSHRSFEPVTKKRLPINAPPFSRYDLLSHRIGIDQSAPPMCHNSHTASAALKSP
jgi:hypothetical protein